MQSKLLKIKLKANSRAHLAALVDYIESHTMQPKYEMQQKGYYWDSLFIESSSKCDYLYMVIKSDDFSKIMVNEDELIATEFRGVYESFRSQCWLADGYKDIEAVACFNSAMVFEVCQR